MLAALRTQCDIYRGPQEKRERACAVDQGHRENMGCDRPIPQDRIDAGQCMHIGDMPMDVCPMKLLDDEWLGEILALRRWFEKGQLVMRCPRPTARTLQALDLLESYLTEQSPSLPTSGGESILSDEFKAERGH